MNLIDGYRPSTREAKREAEERAGSKGMPHSKVRGEQGVRNIEWERRRREERERTSEERETTTMDAHEVAEAIREALASRGQVSDIETVDPKLGVRFGLATAVEGFEGVREFVITVEEREAAASAP